MKKTSALLSSALAASLIAGCTPERAPNRCDDDGPCYSGSSSRVIIVPAGGGYYHGAYYAAGSRIGAHPGLPPTTLGRNGYNGSESGGSLGRGGFVGESVGGFGHAGMGAAGD